MFLSSIWLMSNKVKIFILVYAIKKFLVYLTEMIFTRRVLSERFSISISSLCVLFISSWIFESILITFLLSIIIINCVRIESNLG